MALQTQGSQADEWVTRRGIKHDGILFRSIRNLEADTLRRVDGVVCASRSVQHALERWLPGHDTISSTIVPNFICAGEPCAASRVDADLVSVGRLDSAKNHRFLLEVLAAANRMGRRLTLDVIGEGPCKRSLLRSARALSVQDQVRFLGYHSDVSDRLGNYRVYVHSSTRDIAPFAIIEALAAGLPIFAGRVGGVPELFDHGVEGKLWPLDDPEESARLLVGFMADERSLRTAGRLARARFLNQFDAPVAGPNLCSFLMGSHLSGGSTKAGLFGRDLEDETDQFTMTPVDEEVDHAKGRMSVRATVTTI
ncbi:MAG: glycosyltransferase, partial [Steroidobacteraceae bacterium]